MSRTRQPGTRIRSRHRNSSADSSVSVCHPAPQIITLEDARTETSLSTTNTIGAPCDDVATLLHREPEVRRPFSLRSAGHRNYARADGSLADPHHEIEQLQFPDAAIVSSRPPSRKTGAFVATLRIHEPGDFCCESEQGYGGKPAACSIRIARSRNCGSFPSVTSLPAVASLSMGASLWTTTISFFASTIRFVSPKESTSHV
jgi:hypothetical protein